MSGQIKLKAATLGGDITLSPTDTASNLVVTIPAVTATLLNNLSDIEAQSKTALNATGSAPIYACRAWVNFNGAGTVAIRASGNVSSITDNGTGDYTVNFTTAMPDANFSVVATANNNTAGSGFNTTVATYPVSTSTANIKTVLASTVSLFDAVWISASIFR